MELTADQIQLVLNTRSGTRKSNDNFSSCIWRLKDPVFLPSNEYVMCISTNFLAMPNDHFRITKNRMSSIISVIARESDTKTPEWSLETDIVIPDGSYTVDSMVKTVNAELKQKGYEFLSVSRSKTSRMYELVCLSDQSREYAFATKDFTGSETGADMLGFTSVPANGVQTSGSVVTATRPPDLHGTQTITVKASMNAQNNLDPHDLTRRRSVLAVLPAHSSDINQPGTWDQYVDKEHVLSGMCLDVLELALEDDMGFPLNPNNHWAISLEIRFKRRRDVKTSFSRNFRSLNKRHALLRGSRDW